MTFRHQDVHRILLIKLRALGDSVLTLPSVEALFKGFPQARLSVMCPQAAVEVFNEDPRVDEVIPYERRWFQTLGHHARHAQGLQARHFDLAVCLHASFRTALLGWLSSAPWRSIRNHSGPDWFSNLKAVEPKEPKNIVERDFDALRALGLSPHDLKPRMAVASWAKKEAAQLWKAKRLGTKVALCFPGAGKPEKRWPLQNWVALGRGLKRKGWMPLFLSAPGEPGLGSEAIAAQGQALCVESLQVLAALSARAGRAIGCDSGPRHLAAAAGARTLTLFGPETLREWHPYAREDGHWAVQSLTKGIENLQSNDAILEARAWLSASNRKR